VNYIRLTYQAHQLRQPWPTDYPEREHRIIHVPRLCLGYDCHLDRFRFSLSYFGETSRQQHCIGLDAADHRGERVSVDEKLHRFIIVYMFAPRIHPIREQVCSHNFSLPQGELSSQKKHRRRAMAASLYLLESRKLSIYPIHEKRLESAIVLLVATIASPERRVERTPHHLLDCGQATQALYWRPDPKTTCEPSAN
jgi:hypothetical protein